MLLENLPETDAAERTAAPVIGHGAQVGVGVRFGTSVVVHSGTVIGDGRPGPLTGRLIRAFRDAVSRETERLF